MSGPDERGSDPLGVLAARLRCSVRGCAQPLARQTNSLRCPHGHSFDLARSGYCNLLQPQDRRSRQPGDAPEVVAARRRWMARGLTEPLIAALAARLAELPRRRSLPVLDAGCGEGTMLGSLAERLPLEGVGMDIARAAIDAAARRYPRTAWLVANIDRVLPLADRAFDAVLSVTAHLNPPELHRVLRPEGRLCVAVAAPDDLIGLRQAVQGERVERDRLDGLRARLEGRFEELAHERVSASVTLDAAAIADALLLTYRGGRRAVAERAAALAGIRDTTSWDVLVLAPRSIVRGDAGA